MRHLINNMQITVNIDKLTYAGNLDALKSVETNYGYSLEKIDICDQKALAEVFKKYKPDGVLHLALRHM